jgi:hypothetical protein
LEEKERPGCFCSFRGPARFGCSSSRYLLQTLAMLKPGFDRAFNLAPYQISAPLLGPSTGFRHRRPCNSSRCPFLIRLSPSNLGLGHSLAVASPLDREPFRALLSVSAVAWKNILLVPVASGMASIILYGSQAGPLRAHWEIVELVPAYLNS